MANDQIKKADNGTYYFRANLGFDHSTGKRIQKYRSGFKTKKEAKEEYAKLVLQFASQSLPTEQKRIPFGTFIEDTYLPWYQTQVKESTFENRAGTVRKHFSCFYEKFTDAIEPIDIQNWQLALIRAGYSPNYVRVTQGMLSVAFDRAVILGITERNPSRMVGNVRGQKPLVDFWTLEEFEKVISKLYKGDYYEHYLFISLLFLFMSGMRLGEASALLWSDIDFTTGLCSITKTLYYHNQSDYKFTKPKTRAAIRSIYLDEDTLSELAAWRKVQRVRVHDLRHSHASLLINMGESPLLLKERLGHEKIQTTLGTYGHLYPNTNQAVAKKLTGILNYSEPKTSIANYTSNQHTADYHRA